MGQALVELDRTVTEAERRRVGQGLMQARLDVVRLSVLRDSFADLAELRPLVVPQGAAPTDVARARAALQAQAAEQLSKLASYLQQIAQKRAEAQSIEAAIAKIDATLPFLQETADIRRNAKEIHYGNQIAFIDAQSRLIDQQSERVVQTRRLAEIEAARLALEQQLAQTRSIASLDRIRFRKSGTRWNMRNDIYAVGIHRVLLLAMSTLRAWCLGIAVACFAGAQALACAVPSPAPRNFIFMFEDVPTNLDAPVIVEVTIVGREADVMGPSDYYQIAVGRVDRVVKGQIGEGPLRILLTPLYSCYMAGLPVGSHGVVVGELRHDSKGSPELVLSDREAAYARWGKANARPPNGRGSGAADK